MPALDFDAFLRSIPKGEFAPVYYFHGEQDVLKDDAVRELLDLALDPGTRDFNLDRRRAADLTADDVQSLTQTPPMLAERRAVVITEVELLQQKRPKAQAARAALLAYASKPASDTLLILVQSSGDFAADADFTRRAAAVDFRTLAPDRIRRWIGRKAAAAGLTLDDDAVTHLFDVVGGDLGHILAELGKLKSAVGDRAATAADVADLVGIQRGETAHEFVDAVTGRKFAEAAGMVSHLLSAPGQSGVQLLMALGMALSAVAYARALLDEGAGSAAGSLKSAFFESRPAPFLVRDFNERSSRWAKDAARWTSGELDAALAALLRADKRLKSANVGGETEIVVEAVLTMAAAGAAA